jgi:hypothetical protein
MVWILGAGVAHALILKVKPDGDKGNVILRLGMSNEDYKAAAGLMGGPNPVVDSDIPGMNDINLAVPVSAAQYDRMRANAEKEISTAGKTWCVTCDSGKAQFNVKAEHAFNAALVGTKQCMEKSKSQDLSVDGPGTCSFDNP